MKHWRITLVIGALLLLGGLAVWRAKAQDSVREGTAALRQAAAAAGTHSYVGRKVSEQPVNGKLVKSVAQVARRPPYLRRIHYVSPPLDGVTIWQNEKETYRYDQRSNRLEIYDKSGNRGETTREMYALALRNYEPRLEGREMIAGRPAYRIRLVPRNPGDAWKRLWLDTQTYLKLAQEDYDGKGRLFRRTRFVEIDFEQLDEDAFSPPQQVLEAARKTYSDEERPKSVGHVSSVLGFAIKLPAYVPKGYRLKGAYTYPCECGCNKPAAQVRWTNGLDTISMFQCGHACGDAAPCSTDDKAHASCVHVAVGEESFLFVGETDRANLQKMADSLKPSPTRS